MRVGWGRDGDKAQGFLGLGGGGGGRKEAEGATVMKMRWERWKTG